MKYLIMLLMVVGLVGCADKAIMQCPTCEITGTNDDVSYVCTDCTVEATVTEDGDGGLFKALIKIIMGGDQNGTSSE